MLYYICCINVLFELEQEQQTPLHLSAREGQAYTCCELIRYGADINALSEVISLWTTPKKVKKSRMVCLVLSFPFTCHRKYFLIPVLKTNQYQGS